MTKADRVLSTPRTTTSATNPPGPVDPTRRQLLTVAAGGAVAAMAISTTAQAGSPADPIYAAIEAHRTAYATMQAVFAEHRQAHEVADAKVGPAHLDIPSMVEPGQTAEVDCWWDIERAVPHGQYPDLYAYHNAVLYQISAIVTR